MQFRLSNGYSAAVEFTASGAQDLREQAETALADFRADGGFDRVLELHVAHRGEWLTPIKPTPGGNGKPVRVTVSTRVLSARPADDYGDIWEWCEIAVRVADEWRGFARRAATDAIPPAELGDADRG